MSLPVLSLAVSGAAAAAAASVVGDRVFGPTKRQRTSSASTLALTPALTATSTATSTRSLICAADGFLFFFVYGYVVRHQKRSPTATPTKLGFNEFLASTAAAACSHIFSANTAADGVAGLFASRRGSSAEDLALTLDPGIAFCLQQVLGYNAQKLPWLQRLRYGNGRRRHQQGRVEHAARLVARAALDTTIVFVLAATSKAVSTTLTYPLLMAGRQQEEMERAERTERIDRVVAANAAGTTGNQLFGSRPDVEIKMASIAKDAAEVAKSTAAGAAAGAPAVDTPPESPKAAAFSTTTVTTPATTTTDMARPPQMRRPLALFAGLPLVVARAALSHGLTMAGQRVLYTIVLRLAYAVAGALTRLAEGRRSRKSKDAKRLPDWTSTEQPYDREVVYVQNEEPHRAVENTVESVRPQQLMLQQEQVQDHPLERQFERQLEHQFEHQFEQQFERQHEHQFEPQVLLTPPPMAPEEVQLAFEQVQAARETPAEAFTMAKPAQVVSKPDLVDRVESPAPVVKAAAPAVSLDVEPPLVQTPVQTPVQLPVQRPVPRPVRLPVQQKQLAAPSRSFGGMSLGMVEDHSSFVQDSPTPQARPMAMTAAGGRPRRSSTTAVPVPSNTLMRSQALQASLSAKGLVAGDHSLHEDVADRLRSISISSPSIQGPSEAFYGYSNNNVEEEEEEGTVIYNMISRTQRVVW